MEDSTKNPLTAGEVFRKGFSIAIRAKRKEKGISQVAAAQKIGMDYRHYQNLEGGKINMRLDTMFLLSQFYGLEVKLV